MAWKKYVDVIVRCFPDGRSRNPVYLPDTEPPNLLVSGGKQMVCGSKTAMLNGRKLRKGK